VESRGQSPGCLNYLPWQQWLHEPSVQHFAQPSGQQLPLHAAFNVAAWPKPTTVNTSISERNAIVRFIEFSLTLEMRFTNHASRRKALAAASFASASGAV